MEVMVYGCFFGIFVGLAGLIAMQTMAIFIGALVVGAGISFVGPFLVDAIRDGKFGFLPRSKLEIKQDAMECVLGVEWTEIPEQGFYRLEGESKDKYFAVPPKLKVDVREKERGGK